MSYIAKLMKDYEFEHVIQCDKESILIIKNYFNKFKENYSIEDLAKIESENYKGEKSYHYIICLGGGNNGNANWNNYFKTLANIFNEIEFKKANIKDLWLIKLDNDCLDDVHTIYIGIKIN